MQNLSPSYFFDLTKYQHAAIFSSEKVWEALKHLETYLQTLPLGVIEGKVDSRAYLVDPQLIYIGKGSTVEPGAYIKGPCYIGQNCTVRHGAYIRGNVLTGNGCVIGHDTEVKHTIMLNEAHAAHFAYLGDSILGNKVNLGAGTKFANLKLDQSPIVLNIGEEKIPTGLRKLGAIVGDDSQTGCNSVLNPGTLLGKQVICYPCLNVGGFVPSQSQVKGEAKISISQR